MLLLLPYRCPTAAKIAEERLKQFFHHKTRLFKAKFSFLFFFGGHLSTLIPFGSHEPLL